ncbi:MAG: response regulator transcription factor [Candidatus Limnocylindrales bacterium]
MRVPDPALASAATATRSGEARRALVLHDRPLVADLIRLTLDHGLFTVRAAADLAEAASILAEWRPDIAVIDMEHRDSSALLRRLGAPNVLRPGVTPVLGLTRRGDMKSKLRAFDLGVDDIMTMPFWPAELVARAVVMTRRATGRGQPVVPTITIGEMELDILNRQVRVGQSVTHLTGMEQSLLYVLASRNGRVVTREDILDAVWGPDFAPESNVVDRHVRTLRIKLKCDYRHPQFIETVKGQGYRFIPALPNTPWAAGDGPTDVASSEVAGSRPAGPC